MLSRWLGWWARRAHRVHRLVGSVMALVLAIWFASGAVMTFAHYPRYSERERLAQALPLALGATVPLAPQIQTWLAHRTGLQDVTLAPHEGGARWLVVDRNGVRQAVNAILPWQLQPLTERDAHRRAERLTSARAVRSELIHKPDQWTVGHSTKGDYPLWRVEVDDALGSEVYLCARSGEVVQQSTRSERILAWLGPIPHWVYPAVLRQDRGLWRSTVLWLSALGLVVTFSGLVSGLHVRRRLQRRDPSHRELRDPALRWHQRLGLAFGVFASTWLFSGALSLTPFQWTGDDTNAERIIAQLQTLPPSAELHVGATLARCSPQLDVREIQVMPFAGALYAICLDGKGASRIVSQHDPNLNPARSLPLEALRQAFRMVSPRATLSVHSRPDAYYYPTHSEPEIASPFIRVDLHDDEGTTLYVDPARARVLTHFTHRTRIERWLYHGLHSLDFAPLYGQRALWRILVIVCMSVGFSVASLGVLMAIRRAKRRLGSRQE